MPVPAALPWAMARHPEHPGGERGGSLFLRKTRDQARLEGIDAAGWSDDDYAVVVSHDHDTRVGRIYMEHIHGRPMWRWVIDAAPSPNQGVADSLEEAESDLKRRYRESAGPPRNQ